MRQLREKLGGRGRSSIYLDVAVGRLPPPLKLGGRLLWDEAAVAAHLRALAAEAPMKKGA
jgi:predicted DNA-binding transcriptional regulator AlpA